MRKLIDYKGLSIYYVIQDYIGGSPQLQCLTYRPPVAKPLSDHFVTGQQQAVRRKFLYLFFYIIQ